MNQQPATKNQPTYPRYYRKADTCVRVDNPTEGWIITLPPDTKVPCRWYTAHNTAEHMQEQLRGFEVVDAQMFKDFLNTFYQGVAAERESIKK